MNLLPLQEGEKISAFLPIREFQDDGFIVFATRKGQVKKTKLMAYANPRRGGIIAINLGVGDEVIGVQLTDGKQEILLSTRNGKAIRFTEDGVRATGRGTSGVRGMTLEEGDEVVSLEILNQEATLLTVSSQGYGKRSRIEDYRLQSRGGKGISTLRTTDKTGLVCGVLQVKEDDDLMLVTDSGKIIRIRIAELRVIGRNTQGVKLFNVGADGYVSSIALVVEEKDERRRAENKEAVLNAQSIEEE